MSDSRSDHDAYISDPARLAEWLAACAPSAPLALDTEFERQRTYFAQLCLVQIACAGRIALVDTLALDNLQPLVTILAEPGRRKLLHAARQDLEVLYFAGLRTIEPLSDTQIAAALAGFDEQIGYAELVHQVLGITLDKSQTRTNWRQRPLSAQQLHYAAEDVRHLAALDTALGERLAALGRTEWLAEECRELCAPTLIDPPVADAWQRVKGLPALDAEAFARGVALARWREQRARDRDLPRGWVLKDAEILALAAAAPASRSELAAVLADNPAFVRKHAESVLEVMRERLDEDDPARGAQSGGPPSAAARQRAKACAARVRTRAAELGIGPSLLLTRRDIERLVAGQVPPRATAGWRAALLADVIDEFGSL